MASLESEAHALMQLEARMCAAKKTRHEIESQIKELQSAMEIFSTASDFAEAAAVQSAIEELKKKLASSHRVEASGGTGRDVSEIEKLQDLMHTCAAEYNYAGAAAAQAKMEELKKRLGARSDVADTDLFAVSSSPGKESAVAQSKREGLKIGLTTRLLRRQQLQAKLDNCVAQEDYSGADAAQKELQNLVDVTHPSDAAFEVTSDMLEPGEAQILEQS